ncbi:hypothetical protein PSNTI_31680 [Stutzerimonas stutzeri]|nr:hypothetical protein PSNTI_31680 [Stutzerimonas stutzeri]
MLYTANEDERGRHHARRVRSPPAGTNCTLVPVCCCDGREARRPPTWPAP